MRYLLLALLLSACQPSAPGPMSDGGGAAQRENDGRGWDQTEADASGEDTVEVNQ